MTDFEKHIYNTYLRVSRQTLNKPFRYRKDFTELEGTEAAIQLNKLAALFTKYKHIKIDLFFEAPYKLYTGSTFYLDYYITQKAIKVYSLVISKLKMEDPDTDSQLRFVVESDKFIKTFCQEKGIKVSEARVSEMTDFTNLISLRLRTETGENEISGTVFGKSGI